VDVATGTSGELTLTNVSFLNDNNDLLLIGHENSDFSEMTSDLPTSTLVTNRYDRNWHVKKNDVVGTANGNVMLAFNLGATPNANYTYYLLERAGTSGDFSIVPVIGVNPSGNSMVFTLNASQIDNGSSYTMGRSDAGVGNALDFDGIDDHVVTMIDRSELTDFTAETWYRFTGLTSDGYSPIFAGASADFFIGKNTGNTDIEIHDNEWISNVASGTDAWDGNWHHIAVSRSSGTNSLYLDGALVGSGAYSGGTGIIWVGRENQGSPVHNFDGDMDEISIWSDARTQQEILDNMYKNLAGDETNLVAYYRMNDGIGNGNTSLPDLSGNGNVGTLTNFDNLNTATTASNYVTSTRDAVTSQNANIVNSGSLTASSDELTISSTQTGGNFLQDANDFLQWSNDAADFTETATDVPAGSLITNRMIKTWNITKNDAVGTAHGTMTLSFVLEAVPNPDYTYYLLSRAGTSGDFSAVETIGSNPNGNSIRFTIDGAQVTNGNYFTLGRSDAGAGNTLDFDGTDDYVSIADNTLLDLTNTATWEFWVQVDDVNAVYGVIDKRADFTTNNAYSMGFNYNGVGTGFNIQATSGGTNATYGGMTISQTHFSVNTWHHVAITYNKDATSNFEIYVDGISRPATSQTDIDAALYNSSVNLALGAVNGTGSTINGLIDEVRIWSDVRSKEEIQQNTFKSLDVANESNLVAYYKFNQGIAAGDNTSPAIDLLTDYSGNNNSGTLTGLALSTATSNWVGSEATIVDAGSAPSLTGPGNALDFDGVDDYVDVSSPFNGFTNEITVEFWINATAVAAGSGIGQGTSDIGNATTDVFLIHGNTDGTMRFFVNSGSGLIQLGGNTSTNLENTGWHHIAAVANSSGSSIYVDGVLETSGAGIGTIQNNASSSIHIGKDVRYATARFLNGEIDEVRIWNTAQTADEIQNNMFVALDGNETGLVGYYKFDEPNGSATLPDQTANGNNGTLTNMDAATDWVSATAREPFKTLNAGNWNSPSTWKSNAIPNASSAKLCIGHDITLDADLSADMLFIKPGITVSLASGQTLSMSGNVINNGSIVGDGMLSFTSGTPMLSGTMSNITINGAAPALIGNTTISGTITLTDGIVSLGDYDMTIANTGSLIGGNSSSYLQTKNLNTDGGGLVREVSNGAGQVPFPIGSNGTYTPLTMLNFGSTSSFDVRVFDGTYSAGTSGTAHGSTTEINKTWDVNALGSDFNTTITLQWDSDDQGASFDNTNMFISKNGSRGFWEVVSEGIVASGSGPFTATVSGITSFSQIGGGSGDSPLPVTLMYFTGENLDGLNLLSWQTATELDNERFEIQRANGFLEFVSIGTVAGSGDSDQTLDYSFEDKIPQEGVSYYRLVQVDYDGTATNSKVIMIESEPIDTNMTLYPNPFTDRINIRMDKTPSEPVEVSLYDLNGQLISAIIHQEPRQELTVIFNSLQKGIYFLKVNYNNQIHTERIIKE